MRGNPGLDLAYTCERAVPSQLQFRRDQPVLRIDGVAVDAKAGEKIVFSWQVWPEKATLDSAEARMHEDKRLEVSGEIPFDPKRLILGCFKPVYTMGRE